MAIQWMDNFNIYGTDTNRVARMRDGVYASTNGDGFGGVDLIDDPDPLATGKVLSLPATYGGGGAYNGLRKVMPTNVSTAGQAMRIWLNALPSDVNNIPAPITFKSAANAFLYCLCVTTTGRLEVRAGGTSGTVVGATTNPVVTANAWYHIEMKLFCDAAAGTIEVRVEGVTVLNLTGLNTGTTQISQVEIVNDPTATSAGITYNVKDFIIWDNTGSTNTSFVGTCQVLKLIPTSDTSLGWTPSSGTTGYNLINETTPDDDGTYISAPYPAPSPSQFQLTDLPINVSSVKGVQLMHRSKKTDGGDGNIQVSAVSGANTGNGTDRPITTAYTYWWDIFDLDPSGSAWSRTLVNALQLKLNRTL